jgi:hypothetical protein
MDDLFDAVLGGRVTGRPVPCPAGCLNGALDLWSVLLSVESELNLWLAWTSESDHWTWILPRLNLVLDVSGGDDGATYTLTNWVTVYPPLISGLATILYRLGLGRSS